MKITVAKAQQTAIPELEKAEKTLYYLIVKSETTDQKIILNVGEKSYNGVLELIQTEEQKPKKRA